MTQPHDEEPVPLGFKVVVVLAALYLLWRLVEGIVWVVQRVA